MYLNSFKKSKVLSYYVYEQISSSKKTLLICDNFCLKIACFFTNKSVYETEHKGNRREL